jgi:hypothetical protein
VTRHRGRRPPLTVEQILAWADAYFADTGRWPTAASGPIPEAPGLTWNAVNLALYSGLRGLPRGGSLARLLGRHRLRELASPCRAHTWTPQEDELVRMLPPRQAAKRIGRSLGAVYVRRTHLGV